MEVVDLKTKLENIRTEASVEIESIKWQAEKAIATARFEVPAREKTKREIFRLCSLILVNGGCAFLAVFGRMDADSTKAVLIAITCAVSTVFALMALGRILEIRRRSHR
jgi:hypothetical protein